MSVAARPVATVAAPLGPLPAAAPWWAALPGGRGTVVQQGDAEVAVGGVRVPAPWPRRFGEVTVAPGLVVFTGTHAVRAVAADGATVWEVRHGCWVCGEVHPSFAAYADDPDHDSPDGGSAAFGADGALLWVHVRGPLEEDADLTDDQELWLVLDAATGRVLGRAATDTVASGSLHTPDPDPARMGLSIGQGEEGSPALRGRWDGRRLAVEWREEEWVLLAASPSGRRLLAVDTGQWSLHLLDPDSGEVLARLNAEEAVPPPPGDDSRVHWDFDATFLDEDTLLVGTSESDLGSGLARHWLVDVRSGALPELALRGAVAYPAGSAVAGPVRAAGDGTWATVAADGGAVHLWELSREA
ncbi:hypothetical protein ACFY00_18010 [Kitasatospora sp. NPDC001540]|uniref:hypothetical protein n=1 Tax=Kitasatospora sp. NPDC001540 TaxID=3364014 RepID=UPI0036971182